MSVPVPPISEHEFQRALADLNAEQRAALVGYAVALRNHGQAESKQSRAASDLERAEKEELQARQALASARDKLAAVMGGAK